MCAYATTAEFRRVTNFSASDVSDADLTAMISIADKAIVRLTTTEVYLEKLEGSVDGSNTDFKTKYAPIADSDASAAVDKDDVTVYYATYDDTTNFKELGSAQTVSSVQAADGIIVMDTAPTSATAEAGVYCSYRYDSKGAVDYDIVKLAASYFLAYMVANKIAGDTPDYNMIDAPYIRKEATGADWLKLCFQTLGLQDKIFLTRAEGESI